ncbi:MAG TPA: prolyl oligopeptidase family serine peptidase [Gemmatimonadaceae bacterium]|nr:prolyl oligopeptidase family serine peptidase [Gemmatimonadaceae bacterium]
MRFRSAFGAIGALTILASSGVAQQAATQAGNNQSAASAQPASPFATLPYGAKDAAPVSRWTPPASAGRQLSLNDLLTWKQIRAPQLTNDGKFLVYNIGPNEGDAEVVVKSTGADGKEWRFPVGDALAANRNLTGGAAAAAMAGQLTVSGNSQWAAFLVNPSSATARRRPATGSNAPAMPAKLAVVNLVDGSKREFENVRAFRFAGDRSNWLAIHHAAPSPSGGGTGGGGGGGGGGANTNPTGTMLELIDLAAGASAPAIPIANVSEFSFDDSADWMAYAVAIADQVGNSLQLRQLSTGVTRSLDAAKAQYRRITWADSMDALAAIRVVTDSTQTNGNQEVVTALLWPRASVAGAPVTIDATTTGMPEGMALTSDYSIDFGRFARVLYVGVREPRPARPRSTGGFTPPSPGGTAPGAGAGGQVAAAPQTDADVPSLVLWHWKDPRTQSAQQVQETSDRNFAYTAAYQVAARKLVRLTDDNLRNLQRGPRDAWGVATDISEYERDAGIKGFAFRDLYAVNIATGERKLIQKKVPGGGFGGFGSAFSPDNGKYAYYDTGDWKVFDFASGTARAVTAGVASKFWDDEDDHNQVKPPIGGGLLGWSRDNASIIVRDNWDLWRIPVNGGRAINLTVNGRRDGVRYQNRLVFDNRNARNGIDLSAPMYVETYGEWTKKEGLARVDAQKGGATQISVEDSKVDYRRARDANVWAYTRQSVVRFPDWYAADEGIRNERRLTDANPQQKEVAWTPGARLIDYECENGLGKRQAVLILPAGYEQGKSYPTLTYIYEQLSQGFHAYAQPNATRYSNPSVFTSRGYAFLMPDIGYKIDDPGRSALWCVVPAVKAAIATGIVDSTRVGLQGHSWGGYQTSFITTQTKLFKTAIAGAPLTDMTSMFGSIYWNSGNTDGSIFIASQGRFTGGPNEVPEAYERNSPQTYAQNLSIPFMILHNDRDGAVDFNQGITYYNHLRQLGKEVVLLEYVGENHGLARPANQKDYALRMTEWFDTFLRDQAPPEWLTDGVPRLKMEDHLKSRRPMVDAKAEPPRPKLVP